MESLIDATQSAAYEEAMQNQFDTFKRPFSIYIVAQQAVISTSPTYSRFGQHDQNVFQPPVNPQGQTILGIILYGNKQPYDYMMGDHQEVQNKIRESEGIVRIKVGPDGYGLLKDCKMVDLDGFQFQLNSTPRPQTLTTVVNRWIFTLRKTD